MRFSKSFSRFSYTLAILHGFFIGAVSIGLFAIVIQWQDLTAAEKPETPESAETPETPSTPETPGELTPVTVPIDLGAPVQFYAKQHGVFSSADGATALLQSSPALKSAAIVLIDNKFYVWSAASLAEVDVKSEGSTDSFVKPFQMNSSSCTEAAMQKLPVYLGNAAPSKFNFEGTGNSGAVPKDWVANIGAISALSTDEKVIRIQLISHYMAQNDCLKIEL